MLQLITNADLYTPDHGGECDLLVAGDRIVWVGPPGAAPVRAEAIPTTDLSGKRLVPGLVDCHVHITGGGGEAGPSSAVPPLAALDLLGAGVTSVVGVLGTDDVSRSPASLVTRTYALRQEGMSAWCYTGSYRSPPVTLTGDVRGDMTLVDPIIGVGEIAIADHRSSQPTLETLGQIAADAHVAGMLSGKAGTLHLHLGDGERGLSQISELVRGSELPPRVFHPTHVNRRRALFEEAVELARLGCTVDVTAFPVEDGEDAWSAADAVERFFAAGVPRERLTVSSDAGGSLPVFDDRGELVGMGVAGAESLIETLAELVERGHLLEACLPPFTSSVADLLRLHRKGRIEVGHDADLVALDDSGRVSDVMARGIWRVGDRSNS